MKLDKILFFFPFADADSAPAMTGKLFENGFAVCMILDVALGSCWWIHRTIAFEIYYGNFYNRYVIKKNNDQQEHLADSDGDGIPDDQDEDDDGDGIADADEGNLVVMSSPVFEILIYYLRNIYM